MYPLYRDIRERLGPPLWIDKHGVPRYCEFTPDAAAEIYCDWVALMTVKCQACDRLFQCANAVWYAGLIIESGNIPHPNDAPHMIPLLARWGDAPWHDGEGDECGFDGQCAGTTMTTDWIALRVWKRDRFEWWEISEPQCFTPNWNPEQEGR